MPTTVVVMVDKYRTSGMIVIIVDTRYIHSINSSCCVFCMESDIYR